LTDPPDYQSHNGSQGEIRIYRLERDLRGQSDYALGTIIPEMLKQNPTWKYGDIALLYRTLNEGTTIAESADSLGLSYFRVDNGSPIKRSRLTEWLTDAAKWCAGGWQSGTVSLSQLLKFWRLMHRSQPRNSKTFANRTKLISTLFACRDGSMPLYKWLSTLRDEVLFKSFEEEPGMAEEKDNFDELLKASKKGGALQFYSIEIFGNQGKSPDQINLMTLHSSKGLEFQAVIMIGLEAGVFPSSYDRTEEQMEDAKRLFYVGITRAKRLVHLIYNLNESPLITTIRQSTK
jgi:ATP-dependent DNA helicase Rep/DNA helicase-2/ATP-dependent DNA helicase PcrA